MAKARLLWEPSSARIEAATITRYARWLAQERGVARATGSYADLWQWSVDEIEGFWQSIVDFFAVTFTAPADRVLGSRQMPGADWFPGGRTSYAAHTFRTHHGGRDRDALAIQHASELREPGSWTWGELETHTAQIAAALTRHGVTAGDRVAAYMPNIPETVAAFLACASVGAIWSSAAPEFGAKAVIDRFSQIEPKVVLAVDGYRYGGRDFDRRPHLQQIVDALPNAPRLVTFGYLDGSGWEDGFLAPSDPAADPAPRLDPAELPFDHPLWILYSSGTTGLPKPIVHSQGGMLLEHVKLANLHLDAHPEDRVFWFSTTGWMMWNLLVGVLLTDASIVLFDGNPGYPDLGRLWDLAEQTRMTTFGTSAAYIASCMKAAVTPAQGRDLSALRAVGSTGSPLAPEGFDWVYEQLGDDTWLFSTSGGTDVCSAFVGGVPTLPVHEGELQARALGAKVESWDEAGHARIGAVGELVITEPMPSMPIYLWGDRTGERYRDSYFAMYPGIWRHGDWIEITPEGSAIIYGRSDSTINRGGVRIGTSEIYRTVLANDAVVDALVIDLPRPGTDGSIELFVVLRDGAALTDELQAQIRRSLREDCSPRHMPDRIVQIAEVPRTLSGKALEVPVKRILTGTPVDEAVSRDALANPAALERLLKAAGPAGPAAQPNS